MELSALEIEMGRDKVFPTYTAEISGITRVGFIEVLSPKYANRFYYQDYTENIVYTYVNAPHFSNLQEVQVIPKGDDKCVVCGLFHSFGFVIDETKFICMRCINQIKDAQLGSGENKEVTTEVTHDSRCTHTDC